jgi:uncharacterized protein YkwD
VRRPASWQLALLLLTASAHLAGCAGLEATRKTPGTVANGQLAPGRPAAAAFGPDAAQTCGGAAGVIGYLEPQLASLSRDKGTPVPLPDGRLCSVAEALLGWPGDEEPGEAVRAFLSSHYGLASPAGRVRFETVTSGNDPNASEARDMANKAYEVVGGFGVGGAAVPRFGLAFDRAGRKVNRLVIVLQDPSFELAPLPRRLEPGQKVTLSGQLLGRYENPKVAASDVAGKASTFEGTGKDFRLELACGDKPGFLYVELKAEVTGQPRALSSFKVGCGKDQPATVAASATTWPADLRAQEKLALDEINAARQPLGLPAFAWDDQVANVARAVSEKLREVAGTGQAPQVNLGTMLSKAGVASPVVLQNPGQGRTAKDLSDRFLASPSHRAALLSPEVTHAGIGLVPFTDAEGRPQVIMTQLFTKQLPAVDVEVTRRDLRAAIAATRAAAGVSTLASDATFEEQAQKYARELADAKGSLPPERDEKLVASLSKGYVVKMLVGPSADALEFAKEKKVTTVGQVLGVGVAQGDHEQLGRNAFYVVVLIAEKTGPARPAKKK